MEISAELLTQILNEIPNLEVSIKAEKPAAGDGMRSSMPFRDYAMFWLAHYKKHHVKDNTYLGTYREPVELHLVPYFGDRPLNGISPADVLVFFEYKRGEGYALETLLKMRSCLKAIYETARENHLCVRNPVTPSLKLHSDKPPAVKRCWTEAEYTIAYDHAKAHPKGLGIQIMLETGVSRSELLGFRWVDFDEEAMLLTVNQGLVSLKDCETGKISLCCQGLKNPYRQRMIPISQALTDRLKEQLPSIKSRETTHIIQAPRGGPYNPDNWSKREFAPFMRELIQAHPQVTALTPHELRHTVATIHANSNMSLHLVAQMLGHSNLDMLAKRYLHRDVSVLRKALGR